MNITKNMIPISEFTKLKNLDEEKVIEMIRSGFYVGRKVDDKWYISLNEIEEDNIYKKQESVSVATRIVFALFTAPGIGLLIAFLTTLNVSRFEGAQGFALFYYFVFFTSVIFLLLLFVPRKNTRYILGLISLIGWLVVMILG